MPLNVALGGSQQVIDSRDFSRMVPGAISQADFQNRQNFQNTCLVAVPFLQQPMRMGDPNLGGQVSQVAFAGNQPVCSSSEAGAFTVPGCSVPACTNIASEPAQGMALGGATGDANGATEGFAGDGQHGMPSGMTGACPAGPQNASVTLVPGMPDMNSTAAAPNSMASVPEFNVQTINPQNACAQSRSFEAQFTQ